MAALKPDCSVGVAEILFIQQILCLYKFMEDVDDKTTLAAKQTDRDL